MVGKVAGAVDAHPGAWDTRPSPGEGALPRGPAVPPPAASRKAPKARRPRDALNHLPPGTTGRRQRVRSGRPPLRPHSRCGESEAAFQRTWGRRRPGAQEKS